MFWEKSITGIKPHDRVLDWLPAEDRSHENVWSASLALPVDAPFTVERLMNLPPWHWSHDQLKEGSCVGHGVVMERSISNTLQNRLLSLLKPVRRYDPIMVWNHAKAIDEWASTNPGDNNGTSVHAGYDVALYEGLSRVDKMDLSGGYEPVPVNPQPVDSLEGIASVRWARTVDEVRASIKAQIPVTIGVNWYSNFDHPIQKTGFKWLWIGEGDLGHIRGGHCVAVYAASDRRQAVAIKNSWGADYPLVWMPYTTLDRLLNEEGEAALVVDR